MFVAMFTGASDDFIIALCPTEAEAAAECRKAHARWLKHENVEKAVGHWTHIEPGGSYIHTYTLKLNAKGRPLASSFNIVTTNDE